MYKLEPTQHDESLFFRLEKDLVERHGVIGYLRADFSRSGREFHTTWFDTQVPLRTHAFKAEFDDVINSLRDDGEKPPFASRSNLEAFCTATTGKDMNDRGDGYMVRTQNYSYYFRCKPAVGDYDVYCFVYDNRYLLPELAGKHRLPEMCYSIMPSSGSSIVVRKGETGFFRCFTSTKDAAYNRTYVNDKNKELGVSRAQEEAMLAGSLFGWDKPAARPWHYDISGNPRIPQPKKNEQER